MLVGLRMELFLELGLKVCLTQYGYVLWLWMDVGSEKMTRMGRHVSVDMGTMVTMGL